MKQTKKKVLSYLLTLVMIISQMSGLVVHVEAEESTLPESISYFEEELVSEGIANRYDTGQEGLEFIKNLNSFTMTMQVKTTTSGLQALAGINNDAHANNYISFYMNGGRLGMEIRTSSANDHRYCDTGVTLNDGNWHTVTYVVSHNSKYQFYVDGVKKGDISASTTNFTGTSGWWTPSSVTIAGTHRIGEGSNHYPYTGSIRNVTMYKGALAEEQIVQTHEDLGGFLTPLFVYEDNVFPTQDSAVDLSIDVQEIANLSKSTFSFNYRLEDGLKTSADKIALFSLEDDTSNQGTIYITPSTGTIGFSTSQGDSKTATVAESASMQNTNYHTVTIVFDGSKVDFYFDGTSCGTVETSTFLKSTQWSVTKAYLGGATGEIKGFQGDIDTFHVYRRTLSQEQITSLHNSQMKQSEVFKTEEYGIFDRNDFGAYGYRIPALATTKEGTLLAGIDQRNNATTAEYWLSDHGNIDTVVRRSTDGGATWGELIKAIDLKSQPYDTGTNSALLIDPCFISTESGRIWMLVDMFPESTAAVGFGGGGTKPGTGYVEVDGELYQGLYVTENGQDVLKGTLRGSRMYDLDGNPTDYTVDMGNSLDAYHTKGDMYHNGEYVGNIYLHSKNAGNDSAPYHVLVTMYLWLTYSDDDGKTWSNPVDVTPMVKENWMKFCGVGPGVGLELKNSEHEGRLIFPIYYTPDGTNGIGFQSSACIYSDDGGVTWHRSESPNDDRPNSSGEISSSQNPDGLTQQLTENQIIELNNGHLLQFMRNTGGNGKVAVAKSTDGGTTWTNPYDTNATDVYCQLSVMHYPETVDGKEIIIMSNAAGPGRFNGILRIGEVKEDDSIEWIHENMFCGAKYAYSCLTYIGEGKIGLLYEHLGDNVKYTSFNLEYIKQGEGDMAPHITTIERRLLQEGNDTPITDNNVAAVSGDTIQFVVNFDQDVLVKGNPKFVFRIGGLYGDVHTADFAARGEGKRQLIFEYEVQEKEEGAIGYTGPKILSDVENYVRSRDNYSVSSGGDFVSLGSVGATLSASEEMTKDVDIPKAEMIVTAGSAQGSEPIDRAFDNNTGTLWHSVYNDGKLEDFWVKFDLQSEQPVSGLRYLPRQDNSVNGRIVGYRILVSNDDETYTKVADGSWARDNDWKWVQFEELKNVRYVKLVAIETLGDSGKVFASAAELRITTVEDHEHTYNDVWSCSGEGHYHACTAVEGCPEKGSVTEHTYSEATVAKKATCTAAGVQVKECEICGYEAEEIIEADGHDFGEWEVVREATNEKTGAKRRYCDVCGTYEEEILSYSEGGDDNTDEPGDDQGQQDLAATKLALEAVITEAGTKVQTEYTEESWTTFATALEAARVEATKADATKATLEAAKTTLEEAMNGLVKVQDGENEGESGDDNTDDEVQHIPSKDWSKDATHHWHVCTFEGCTENQKHDLAEHKWDAGKVTKQPTATATGEKTFTCTVCEATKKEVVSATGTAGGNNNAQGGSGNQGESGNQGGQQQEQQKEVEAAKNELNNAIQNATTTIQSSAYTKETFDTFQTTLKEVQSVFNNPNATKADIEAAKVKLQTAIQGLKPVTTQKPEEQKPEEQKPEEEKPAEVVKPGVTFKSGTYQFKITSATEAQFTGVATSIKTVKIANTISYGGKTLKVTSVANNALKGDKVVTKVVLGSNIKNIGNSAFEGCTKLTSINLKNVTKIGNKAFKKCTSLKKVTIPKKVTNLGKSVFEGCKKLSAITIKATGLKRVGKNTFKNISAKAKIKVPKKNLAKYKKLLKNKGQGKKVSIK